MWNVISKRVWNGPLVLVIYFFMASLALAASNSFENEHRFLIAKGISQDQIDKIKKGMDKYIKTGDTQSSGSEDSGDSGDSGDSKSSPDISSYIRPSGGQMPTISTPNQEDPQDRMFCDGHMKLATKYFKSNNFERVDSELKLIFERIPDYPKGRFMKAIVSAKKKDFLDSWRNIVIAEKAAPNNKKIQDFIVRLQKVSPKPEVIPEEIKSVDRSPPTFASMLIADSIDDFLAHPKIKGKFSSIGVKNSSSDSEGSTFSLLFAAGDQINADEVKEIFQEVSKTQVQNASLGADNRAIEISLVISNLPKTNPSVLSVSELDEFIKEKANECDLRVQTSKESDPDADSIITVVYDVTAGGMDSINTFLRKISSNTVDYMVTNLSSSSIAGKAVWKGELQIRFKKE